MTDRLPCPFCGSTNLRYEFAGSQGYICCDNCGTQGPCDEQAADPICDHDAAYAAWNRRAATLLQQQSALAPAPVPVLPDDALIIEPAEHTLLVPVAQPVPVSERLPGPEDCDGEGRYWGLVLGCEAWALAKGNPRLLCITHWLPANALPLPTPEATHD